MLRFNRSSMILMLKGIAQFLIEQICSSEKEEDTFALDILIVIVWFVILNKKIDKQDVKDQTWDILLNSKLREDAANDLGVLSLYEKM